MNMTRALPGVTRPLTLAVLVDGENITPDRARPALDCATEGHHTQIRRVYGCPNHVRVWADWCGFHGVFTVPTTGAKNTADFALVIDAMELALRNRAEGFVLVTSDGDFTRLATWLRENGFPVFGIGEKKTPEQFRLACTEFFIAEGSEPTATVKALSAPTPKPVASPDATPINASPPEAASQHECAAMSRALAERLRARGGRALLSRINPMMRDAPGARLISQTPYGKWRTFLEARPNVYRITGKGPETMVELVQTPPAIRA